MIYVAFAALAVRQVPRVQRRRRVHRRVGWWPTAAGVLNAAWVALFAHRAVAASQLVIIALLLTPGVAASRLRTPARGWGDRLLLHLPVTVYLGRVAMATVAGAATTAASFGVALPTAGAITALLLTGSAAAAAVLRLPAVVGFAAAVCRAPAWIAVRTPAASVQVVALVAIVAVAVAAVIRIGRGRDRSTAAWG